MPTKKLTQKDILNLKKKVLYKPKHVWDVISEKEKKQIFSFCDSYKQFLNHAKTERESVQFIESFIKDKGFELVDTGANRCYTIFNNKCLAVAIKGTAPMTDGVRLIASHIDSPRLDLKQNPLYEEVNLSLLKTHYYGGIRKYQWLARPLAIHGRIMRHKGKPLDIVIGENPDDPVFTIADLLPHLSRKKQGNKKINEAIEGEKLNVLIGGLPIGNEKIKERFKLNILKILNDQYDIIEEDFMSAELEIVPAGEARDIGFDRSMIGAYGHDDRVCVFSALKAMCQLSNPKYTAIAIFFDKEEIGSEGNTSANSNILELFISQLMACEENIVTSQSIITCLTKSKALSGDVNAAIDPDYQDVHEKRNAAKLGFGVCISKFTGHGGKYGSNDASAEYLSHIREIFNKNKIVWQTGEVGKVDEGGGGTIAKYLAMYGMDIVDCGTPVLSMHSPFEIASKPDIYMTYKSYLSFWNDK